MMVFIHLIHFIKFIYSFKKFKIEMDSLGSILYWCTLLLIICEHLHDLTTFKFLSGWKGLTKFIPRDCLNSTLIYILFSLFTTVPVQPLSYSSFQFNYTLIQREPENFGTGSWLRIKLWLKTVQWTYDGQTLCSVKRPI